MEKGTRSLVVGSGIAGMASAIRLANLGFEVHVFEKNHTYGGKIGEISMNGYRFDAGPSLFTLPELVDELFRISGKDPKSHFNYKKKDLACVYYWEDGTRLEAWSSPERFDKEASRVLNIREGEITTYLENSRRHYEITTPIFLEKSLHRLQTYLSKDTLKAMLKLPGLDLIGSMDSANRNRLSHPKLVQLFNRFATYNGSNPYQAPALLNLIPHLEHGLGTFFPKGGIRRIVDSMYELAVSLGVNFHFDEPVREILVNAQSIKGLRTSKRVIEGEIVVNNMDVYPTYKYLLPEVKMPDSVKHEERSSSAMIFYWGIARKFPQLDLHNILFSDDYKREFEGIFGKKAPTDDPTVYIHISSKEEQSDAPDHGENWFVMVNMPPNRGQNWPKLVKTVRNHIINKINRVLQVDIEPLIECEDFLDPVLIESRTSSYMGSLYGTSSNNRLAAFLRHPNFHQKIKGLYFVGGSVHPGGGMPLCLLSARVATDLVAKDREISTSFQPKRDDVKNKEFIQSAI